jgi:uncharacterized protein
MTAPVTADEIKALLKLEPHPVEGGWYRRTYTSEVSVALLRGVRPYGTAIYYLLEEGTFSEMHMVASDEIFHFYLGDPVEMLQLGPTSANGGRILTLGSDIAAGQQIQTLAPAGVWQGSRLRPGGAFALMGATVAPGFDFADYEAGDRDALMASFPDFAERINRLCL